MTDVDNEDVLEIGSARFRAHPVVRRAMAGVAGLAVAVAAVVVAAPPDVVDGRGMLATVTLAPGHTSTAPTPSSVRGIYFLP